MHGLDIRRLDRDGVRYVQVSGELDLANVEEFRGHLDGCADGERLVVDTSDLSFIDSTGLGVLVSVRKERGPDHLVLIPGPATERLLDLSRLREFFGLE
jgi:anti-sigma B factor antagonist